MMKKIVLCYLCVACTVLSVNARSFPEEKPEYSKMSPYTSILLREARKNAKDVSPSMLRSLRVMEDGKRLMPAIVEVADASGWDALEAAGCQIRTRLNNLGTVDIPLEQVEALSGLSSISYIEASRQLSLSMDSACVKSNAEPAYVGEGLSHPYTGKGVVVGVVDTGFDFTHPTLYDASGEEYRVKYIWNQRAAGATGALGYGEEYMTEEECLRARTDITSETHAAHVAGIAAGSGYSTPYRGVAYESDIYIVGTTMRDPDILDGVSRIFERAQVAGKPCVVNLSLGSTYGPHDGTDLQSRYLSAMTGPGRIIVAGMGNDQSKKLYVDKGFDRDTLSTFFQPMDSLSGIFIWGDNPGQTFSASVALYDAERGMVVDSSAFIPVDRKVPDGADIVLGRKDAGTGYHVYFGTQLYPGNNKYNMVLNIEGSKREHEYLLLRVVSPEGGIKAWSGASPFESLGLGDRYSEGRGDHTIGEPATGVDVIAVGSYDNRVNFENAAGEVKYYKLQGKPGEISLFSSLGPTADGRIKPDVVAPGGMLISSFNSFYTGGDMDSLIVKNNTSFRGKDYSWICMSGTSMACPFVTGSIALWLQADPTLAPDDIKDIFYRTAVRDKKMEYPNTIWGNGKIDVYNGLLDVLDIPTSTEDLSEGLPAKEAVSVYTDGTPGMFHLRWAEVPGTFTVHVYDMEGRPVHEERMDRFAAVDYTVFMGSAPAGIYVVTIETEAGMAKRKVAL